MKFHNHIPTKYFLAFVFFLSFQWAFGQDYSEILQYSTTEANGSARTVGAGAGISALGADLGSTMQKEDSSSGEK